MAANNSLVIVRDLPVLALEAPLFFPGALARVPVADGVTAQALAGRAGIRKAAAEPGPVEVVLLASRSGEMGEGPQSGSGPYCDVGVWGLVEQVLRDGAGQIQAVVKVMGRVRILSMASEGTPLTARVEDMPDVVTESARELALARVLSEQFREMVSLTPGLRSEIADLAAGLEGDRARLVDFVVSGLELKPKDRQLYLAEVGVAQRLERATLHLGAELEVLRMGQKIRDQLRDEMGQSRREHLLREQMKAIHKELGETDDEGHSDLRSRLDAAGLPEEAQREAARELARLDQMPPESAEGNVARTYLDWLAALPWSASSRERLDVERAGRILNEDHKGLEKVKERILDYVAVRQLRAQSQGPIFCLAGPPGVGKTSLARSMARSLGREFARISLGGVRDESEIRGHRRTYVGALPGRIIQALRSVGKDNPVILLDEIDKLGSDFRGDPAAALLEVLDPAQNATFTDHYLDVPFDLSKVIFVATANQLQPIPPALLDRMEVVELSGYTEAEKIDIAQGHLIPRQLRENGISRRRVTLTDDAVQTVIRRYTREAGVRNLERELGTICRKIARTVVEGASGPFRVTGADVHSYLGPERRTEDGRAESAAPGLVAGLAWTPAGGEVMFVEASRMRGGGGLRLTGKLGDVMRESAQIALSFVRSRGPELGVDTDFSREEMHVHLPSGAIPKDGPSAGVAMTTALVSLLTDTPVREDVAMTGEVTLRGRVLPVGGIKEKVLAAHRAGMRTVILPSRNERDLDELPDDVRDDLEFVLASEVHQALEVSLVQADRAVRQAA